MKHLAKAMFTFVVATATACPQPAPEPLESVDGLQGGALSTDLSVPALAATAVSATNVDATNLVAANASISSLTAETATIGTLDAVTMSAESANVDGALATGSVDTVNLTAKDVTGDVVRGKSLRLVSTSQPLDDGSLLGVVVGVTEADGGGYQGLNSVCDNAFPGAHVCGELEVLHFLRSINFPAYVSSLGLAAINGASYATVTKQMIGLSALNEPIIADDCESWYGIQIPGSPAGLHARHVLSVEDVGGFIFGRIDTSNLCTEDDLRVLCCGE